MFVFVPPPPPSPRAEVLGQRLAELIEQHRQQNPDLSGLEVRQAVQIALNRAGGRNPAAPALLAVILGVLAAGGLFAALVERGQMRGEAMMVAMMVLVLAVVAGVLFTLKNR
jgi:hypothetical protein